MIEPVDTGKLVELGDRHAAKGELEQAACWYNRALKRDLYLVPANLGLADVYRRLAEAGRAAYFRLAAQALRRVLRREPLHAAAHDRLLQVAFRAGALDELSRDYGAKVRAGDNPAFYGGYLRRVEALSLMDTAPLGAGPGYRPAPCIKYFFDLLVLPGAVLAICAANLAVRLRPLFVLGLTMFLFYCLYRIMLYLLLRR